MIIAEKLHIMFRDKEIFHVKNHKGENESMQEQTRTPVFQNSDGTWGHLTKTINPLICTIEYRSSTIFSSKKKTEKSYQKCNKKAGNQQNNPVVRRKITYKK